MANETKMTIGKIEHLSDRPGDALARAIKAAGNVRVLIREQEPQPNLSAAVARLEGLVEKWREDAEAEAANAAPREPQPSSERLDPLQIVGPAPGTMHPVNQPSSEASAPLSVHPSHVMGTQRASKMASCVNCDRPLDWPCDINNQREPREPHAALLTEIEGVIAEDGFSGGPDKRKSTGKLEAWCPECSSYREEGHDEDCRWLRGHKLLRRCKAAILGSPTEGEQG